MSAHLPLILIALLASAAQAQPMCTDAWYRTVEQQVTSGDGQGHGPDVGSDEWKSVIEFKLGVRGRAGVPGRDTDAWCRYIDRLVVGHAASMAQGAPTPPQSGRGPSFSCDRVAPGSIEAMVCADGELAALDRKLAGVHSAASKIAANERPPQLRSEQRGWIKGRGECWKNDDKRACVLHEYMRRIAELQARYRLVPGTGPVRYFCDDNPANEVVATFFQTDPPTAVAERGDSVSVMYAQPSASGVKYQGRNESLREHEGETLIQWGYGAAEMRCRRSR